MASHASVAARGALAFVGVALGPSCAFAITLGWALALLMPFLGPPRNVRPDDVMEVAGQFCDELEPCSFGQHRSGLGVFARWSNFSDAKPGPPGWYGRLNYRIVEVRAGVPFPCVEGRVVGVPSGNPDQDVGFWWERDGLLRLAGSGKHSAVPLQLLPWGVLANGLTFTMLTYALTVLPGRLRRSIRMQRGKCPTCGYQLGDASLRCPECGWSESLRPSGHCALVARLGALASALLVGAVFGYSAGHRSTDETEVAALARIHRSVANEHELTTIEVAAFRALDDAELEAMSLDQLKVQLFELTVLRNRAKTASCYAQVAIDDEFERVLARRRDLLGLAPATPAHSPQRR